MRVFLQSPYLALEYLHWRKFNGLPTIEVQKVCTLDVESRNLLIFVSTETEKFLLKQYGSQASKSFIANEHLILSILKISNLSEFIVEVPFFDEHNLIICIKWYEFHSLENFLAKLRLRGKWNDIEAIVKNVSKIFYNVHSFYRDDLPKVNPAAFLPIEYLTVNEIALIGNWSDKKSLIHYDLRLANILINNTDPSQIKLIDWEFAMAGDPLWDIAVFIYSLCITLGDSEFFIKLPPARFDNIKPIVKAFLQVYGVINLEKLKIYLRLYIQINDVRFTETITKTTIDTLLD
ncbi:phosphotransferase [Runella limosa]|uniref:phosphotransferase n=1 Tax=Runella limosa TaxID=370978 RepID=UPI000491F38A|nr:phosphotransferase [Runella limosa]